jgi:hypothetical protein
MVNNKTKKQMALYIMQVGYEIKLTTTSKWLRAG